MRMRAAVRAFCCWSLAQGQGSLAPPRAAARLLLETRGRAATCTHIDAARTRIVHDVELGATQTRGGLGLTLLEEDGAVGRHLGEETLAHFGRVPVYLLATKPLTKAVSPVPGVSVLCARARAHTQKHERHAGKQKRNTRVAQFCTWIRVFFSSSSVQSVFLKGSPCADVAVASSYHQPLSCQAPALNIC